jgi:hypothetical protein
MFTRIIISLLVFPGLLLLRSTTVLSGDAISVELGQGSNLFQVDVSSHADARALLDCGVDAVIETENGYLVLTDNHGSDRLAISGLSYWLIATNIDRNQLAIDVSGDKPNKNRFPLIYEEGDLRLYRIEKVDLKTLGPEAGLIPVPVAGPEILYKALESAVKWLKSPTLEIGLEELVSLVSQDSIESYSEALQGFSNRPSETNANNNCAHWLFDKFMEFGCDSVAFDHFIDDGWWEDNIIGKNVLAYKFGSPYHHDRIIVCAHFDGVSGSPAADDNGSGVAAVLEIARILQDFETNLTIVYALWDAEEDGLVGSYHYAREAAEEDERIVLALNLDMIGYEENSDEAFVFYQQSHDYAALWAHLADSLPAIDITAFISTSMLYNSAHSDHRSFINFGYDGICAHERIFCSEYHQPSDSTTYLNFDYMTRITMASLATTYSIDGSYIPTPALVLTCSKVIPEIVSPGSTDTLQVHVEEYAGGIILPGSVCMHCSINDEPYVGTPMIDLGNGEFVAELPSISCGDIIKYYVSAADQTTGHFYYYPESSSPAWAIMAAAVKNQLDDNFETDLGWTVQGNATSGDWERWRAASNAVRPRIDYDYSGKCYITDHSLYEDVDNGTTSLLSPLIDVSNGKATIEYAYWFDNGEGLTGHEDMFRVYIHNGSQWMVVDTAGPVENATGGWVARKFWLHDICPLTGPVRIRFDASDDNFDSDVEAAVDAVKVTLFSIAPEIYTEILPDVLLGDSINHQFDAAGCYEPLAWIDKNGDLEGSGLTLSSDGLLTGLPADTGEIYFTVLVEDGEGVSAEQDYAFHVWLPFICGDATMDYQLNIGDAVYLVNFVFKGGPAPYPICVGDANHDSDINVGDAVYLINHIFKGGPAPVENCCF